MRYCLPAICFLVIATRSDAEIRQAADALPRSAVITVTIQGGGDILERFRGSEVWSALQARPEFQAFAASPDVFRGRMMINGFVSMAGLDLWQAAGALLGRETTFSIRPGLGGRPEFAAAVLLDDPGAADALLEVLNNATGVAAGGRPDPSRSTTIDGVVGYKVADRLFYARFDDFLVYGNSAEFVEECIRLRSSTEPPLSGMAAFRQSRIDAGGDAPIWAFADMDRLTPLLGASGSPFGNAFSALLFGGIVETARHGGVASASLRFRSEGLSLRARLSASEPLDESLEGFAAPAVQQFDWAQISVPRELGKIMIGRDLNSLWDAQDLLLDERGRSRLLNFSTTFSTLAYGLDFVDQLLPSLGTGFMVVASRQDYAGAQPIPPIPSFALLIPIKPGLDIQRKLNSGALTVMSFINSDRGNKGKPQYLIDKVKYGGCSITYAEYDDPPPGSGPPAAHYNFSPATAMVKDCYVVSSTRQLLEDIIDASQDLVAPSVPGAPSSLNTAISLSGEQVYQALWSNRDGMIDDNMIKKDRSRAAAEKEIDGFLQLVALADTFEAGLAQSADAVDLEVDLSLRLSK